MLRLLTMACVGLGACLVLGAADDKDAAKKDQDKLQGEWTLVSAERDGQPLSDDMIKTGKRVCKDDETSVLFDGQLYMKAKFKLDPSKKPTAIDYEILESQQGDAKGQKLKGIYAWDGDQVKFCFGQPGGDRPDDFTAKEGSGRVLSVWKKAKK